MYKHLILVGAATLALSPARAQTAQGADDFHVAQPNDIVITAPFSRERSEFLTGISVLSGAELAREVRPTIGETIARLPGVSSTSFGPNASRPVLRGLQGERVRVLTDGIGSFDASNTSADHAVAINPFLAERVEVLRGPAALQFGSSAIGGVVNVIDRRIPRALPDEGVHVDAFGGYGSAADQWFGAGSADLPVGGKIVLHLDGSYLDGDDLRIGSFVLSRRARAEALASANTEVQALASLRGRLPNSSARTWDVAGGAAVITEGGNLGFAISRYDSLYGVPPRFDLTSGEGEAPMIDIKQTRIDARSEVQIGGFFELMRARFGFADYKQNEIEPSGEIGTTFLNKALEGRLELVQSQRGPWKGALGGQIFIRDFNAIGEEAFLPENETEQFGLFTLQQLELGKAQIEFGGRVERTRVSSVPLDLSRRFTALSGSVGASVEIARGWRIGTNVSHTERAPSAEELFSNGPHAGTQSFELGDPDLRKERNLGAELVLRGSSAWLTLEVSAYYNRFSNFIFENATGAEDPDEGLPIFAYRQDRARFYGVEGEISAKVANIGTTRIGLDAVADYVRATIPGVGPVPRIPPLRLLGGLSAANDHATARLEVEHSFKQDRIAAFESDTDAFTLVNASLAVRPFGTGPNKPELLIQANNIFDVDARRHASFLKDFAPLAGRDVRVTLRASF
jgi:iron complex outermembrane recepter protein